MSTFDTLLQHVRQNDSRRQQYLEVCKAIVNEVVSTITADVRRGGGSVTAHKDGRGDETVNGALRMHLQLDLPAPLTFDLYTTHLHTWVGVRPLGNGEFELTMPGLTHPAPLQSSQTAAQVFFQHLMETDDLNLREFTGEKESGQKESDQKAG